jgi:hypothetical protein
MSPLCVKGKHMLWTIIVVLVVLWILGFSFHLAGGLIHVLLVIALVVLIIKLLTGRRGDL